MTDNSNGPDKDHKRHYENGIVTPLGRFSFPYLVEPDSSGPFATNKYKVTLLIPRSADVSTLLNAIVKLAVKAHGLTGDPKAILAKLNHPLRDGDTKPSLEGYAGHIFLTAKSRNKPLCVGRDGKPVDPAAIYGGSYGRLKLTAGSYVGSEKVKENGVLKVEKTLGVSFFLEGVQFAKDGERFTKHGSADGFEAIEEEAGGSADSLFR